MTEAEEKLLRALARIAAAIEDTNVILRVAYPAAPPPATPPDQPPPAGAFSVGTAP